MKRVFIIVFAMLAMMTTITVKGTELEQEEVTDQVTMDGVTYELSESGTARVLILDGISEIVIPAMITYEGMDYMVTEMADCAAFKNTVLTSVTLPGTMETLPQDAFAKCSKLREVIFPSGLTSIGARCFYMCTSLETVEIPFTVETIDEAAFNLCTGLTSVTMPASLQSIGDKAFHGCGLLTSIEIPAGVSYIGTSAFRYCTKLQEYVVDSGSSTFCSPEGVLYNKNMTELIAYPDGKTDATYVIPDGVICISDTSKGFQGAVMSNEYLKGIYVPDSLTEIKADVYFTMETDTLTFYGSKDSYIHRYAAEQGYGFQEYTEKENYIADSLVTTGGVVISEPTEDDVTDIALEPSPQTEEVLVPSISKKIKVKQGARKKIKIRNIAKSSSIRYKIKNKKVARVSAKGIVGGKKKGTTKLIVIVNQNSTKYRLVSKVIVTKR